MKIYCRLYTVLFLLCFFANTAVAESAATEPLQENGNINSESTNAIPEIDQQDKLIAESNSPEYIDSTQKPEIIAAPEKAVAPEPAAAPEPALAPEPAQAPGTVHTSNREQAPKPAMASEPVSQESIEAVEETAVSSSTETSDTALGTATDEAVEMAESEKEQYSVEPSYIPDPELFQAAVKQMLPDNNYRVVKLTDGETIYNKGFILKLYEQHGYKPLWTPISIHSLADSISALILDGLNPYEYRFAELQPYLSDPSHAAQSAEESARIDVLLTEAFIRAMYNLDFGKVDPELLDADHNYTRERNDDERVSLYLTWIGQGRIDEAFSWARPKDFRYKLFQSTLTKYLKIQEQGGWEMIPGGRAIKYGKSDERVPMLRARLAATGDLDTADGTEHVGYDLEQGIRSFQERHDLKVDGVVGPGTLRVLNVPVEERIQQIRANLERLRWYFPKDIDEYLLIDVAGFQVYWMKNHEIYWEEFVQVGKRFTTTPIFRDQIEHIDFNPTWSVPPGINRRTILPSLRIDTAYLDKKGYQLLDHLGNEVDPYDIDWDDVEKMPYTVRQPPGWGNALGKVKFMFPNKHSVFLHDTNHREMFAKQKRTTSSGCIRLRNPFVFAEMLLERQEGWDRQAIDDVVASNVTTRVDLEKPLPILIQYTTISATEDRVVFREDIYRRDASLLRQLDAPFQLHLPDLPKSIQERLRSGVKSASASAAKFLPEDPEIIGEPHDSYHTDSGDTLFDMDEGYF